MMVKRLEPLILLMGSLLVKVSSRSVSGRNGRMFTLADMSCHPSFEFRDKKMSQEVVLLCESECKENHPRDPTCQKLCTMMKEECELSIPFFQIKYLDCKEGQPTTFDEIQVQCNEDKDKDLDKIVEVASKSLHLYGISDEEVGRNLTRSIFEDCAQHYNLDAMEEFDKDFTRQGCLKVKAQAELYVQCVEEHWKCQYDTY